MNGQPLIRQCDVAQLARSQGVSYIDNLQAVWPISHIRDVVNDVDALRQARCVDPAHFHRAYRILHINDSQAVRHRRNECVVPDDLHVPDLSEVGKRSDDLWIGGITHVYDLKTRIVICDECMIHGDVDVE